MITREGRFVFDYDTVNGCIKDLLKVEIGKVFVSEESVHRIEELLNLKDKKTEEELRAVRNAVVDVIHDLSVKTEDRDLQWDYGTKISGITAVIDNWMWKQLGHV